MAVLKLQMLIESLFETVNTWCPVDIINRACSYTVKNNSLLHISVFNRYAIPPEHGKRLERLATGKRLKGVGLGNLTNIES